jgi:DUF1680 family protein
VSYLDDFSAPITYLTNGVAGTMWDGVYLAGGEIAGATGVGAANGSVAVADADISGSGRLTFASLQTDWEDAADDGVFLFKVITGDFDMSVHIVGPADARAYNLPGLMVRAFGPGGSPAPGGAENSLLWSRFDWLNDVNMLKNNINGSKTDTVLGAPAPNTNYWLRISRVGSSFTLFERAAEGMAWNPVGTVARSDFTGLPLQVGLEHSDYAGGVTCTAQYEQFSLTVSNQSPGSTPPPASGLSMAASSNQVALSWTAGAGSSGSLVVMWTGGSALKAAPANGFTYSPNAAFGLGDALAVTNCYVVYSGGGTSVTVSNLASGTTCHAAVFAYTGAGNSRTYQHLAAAGAVKLPGLAAGEIAAQASVQGTNLVITFNSKPPKWYRVQATDSLNPPAWQNLNPGPVQATSTFTTWIQPEGVVGPRAFYRVQEFADQPPGANLAPVAAVSTSYVSPWETLGAINSGYTPANSADHSHGAYGNWPQTGTQWVEYDWSQPITVNRVDVYWWADGAGISAPVACRLKYWDGANYVLVSNPSGLGVALNQFNTTSFDTVTTTRLRLEFDSNGSQSTGILQWRVYDAGDSPNFPPRVTAGVDRDVVVGGQTYLGGSVQDDGKLFVTPVCGWSQLTGPGEVIFDNPGALTNSARFSIPGTVVLALTAYDGQYRATNTLKVAVAAPAPATHALPVYPAPYRVNSPLWTYRLNKTLTNWIPHLYAQLNNPALAQGNINSFIQASNKLAGKAYTVPAADPWADAYTLNAVEAMCYALLYDAQGDPAILQAQATFRTNLNYWIPIILGAQEPDGYLHTYTTLRGLPRWSNNTLHEGYVGGYFIEAALAHYLMTGRADPVFYNAARKLADCWCNNLGPGKETWYDGHENMEQALVHLGRFMNEFDGAGSGQKYIDLAKFLIDTRGTPAANAALNDGSPYDQSHLPAPQQYEAMGHGVRAVYLYSGIEDVAIETGDLDDQSAALSLWDNMVNRKYYVTGGICSGETAEGFGPDYSLPNNSYCEACSSCGELFFAHKLNLARRDARYADVMETILYNAILGDLDDQASNYTYTNPLDQNFARYAWHSVPCCVGNVPRTLFQLPTWMYARTADTLYVNLFIGSTVTVDGIAGTSVQIVQTTDYPWNGSVSLVVNPAVSATFTLAIRMPNRATSALYTPTPAVSGISSIQLNGSPSAPTVTNGYALITRQWMAGDRVDVVLPLVIQRVKAASSVTADAGLVALQYGPLIYNVESVDQDIVNNVLSPAAPLSPIWNGGLLGGLTVISGSYTNGSELMAIPNYARNNRGGRSIVWFRDQ